MDLYMLDIFTLQGELQKFTKSFCRVFMGIALELSVTGRKPYL